MEVGDAVGVCAEAARGNGGKGVADGIVERHWSEPIEQGAAAGQHEVDEQHAACCGANLRPQLVQPQACHLGRVEVAVLHLVDRDEGKGEDHDAQAAYPLRDGSPEEQAAGQDVYLADAGGTRRGEAAHRLEEGAGDIHVGEVEVGHHADHGEDNPGERHDEEVVGPSHPCGLLRLQEDLQKEPSIKPSCREQKDLPAGFAVNECHNGGEQQEEALHDDEYAEDALFHFFYIILIPHNPSNF